MQHSPTRPQQTAAGAVPSTAAGQPDPANGQPGEDCVDLEEDLPGSAAPAQRAAPGAAVWMPSSMDEVRAAGWPLPLPLSKVL